MPLANVRALIKHYAFIVMISIYDRAPVIPSTHASWFLAIFRIDVAQYVDDRQFHRLKINT